MIFHSSVPQLYLNSTVGVRCSPPSADLFVLCPFQMLLSQEDCYPKSVKLGKGGSALRLQVRHDNTAYLDKLKKMPLLLDRSLDDKVRALPSPLFLPSYPGQAQEMPLLLDRSLDDKVRALPSPLFLPSYPPTLLPGQAQRCPSSWTDPWTTR